VSLSVPTHIGAVQWSEPDTGDKNRKFIGPEGISYSRAKAVSGARPSVNTLLGAVSTLFAYSVGRDALRFSAEAPRSVGLRCGGDTDGGVADAPVRSTRVSLDELPKE
jgi:hypothetical protein